jgi:hypothetical protein
VRDAFDVHDALDALSFVVGICLLPLALLWRTCKLAFQLACDR